MKERDVPERRGGGEAGRLLISTVPFAQYDGSPRAWLGAAGIEVVENGSSHGCVSWSGGEVVGIFVKNTFKAGSTSS